MTLTAIPPFGLALPGRILFGRGEAAKAPGLIRSFGTQGVLVTGASPARADWLIRALTDLGAGVEVVTCPGEPTLSMLEAALDQTKGTGSDWLVALGGGSAIDLGKALAALIPAPGTAMDHMEVVGQGLPLVAAPLPFVALPTTAGTGAEATRNAVIGATDHGRKVSIRDDRMLPRVAIIDPALTDGTPWQVTLASGMDALAQVIEPYVSSRATPFTDALVRPAIGQGLAALTALAREDTPQARDHMAWVSLTGGVALANSGLGAVHGLAGVIGGLIPAAHGALCGALLGPVLAMNRARTSGPAHARIEEVCALIGETLGVSAAVAPKALANWAHSAGLPGLTAMGLDPKTHASVAAAALQSSSMKGNPVALSVEDLQEIMRAAG